ncbi:hypothetical protein GALL_457400 [mine drainage metagenome]|uniref:Uncharacterized protein n=1 Tax=mine drainage metagenome TaxID=410659 RepID=A0A1J5PYI5_9ZZZZ
MAWLFVHRHHTLGVADDAATSKRLAAADHARQLFLVAVDDEMDVGIFRGRLLDPGDNCRRAAIASHGVNGYHKARGAF